VDDRLRAIRARLVEQMRTLTDEVSHGLDTLSSEEDRHHIADLEDLAGDSGADSVLFEQFRSSGVTLEQIQRALERIEEGSYDRCEECEGEIGEARLTALPFATHCIGCKRKLESASG